MRIRHVLVLLLLVLAAGCGVPVQDSPVPVQPEAVPSQLHDTVSPPTAQPTTAAPGRTTVVVHFVTEDRLVPSIREATGASPAERLDSVVAALLAGPTEDELARGVTSALPPGLELTVAAVDGSQVAIGLAGETDGRSATENVLAVGQIVLSVTALPTVDSVTFERDGAQVEALLADGALTTEPLTAADYAALRR